MRVFADSSALLKAYLDEPGSGFASRIFGDAAGLVASRIAQAEVQGRLLRQVEAERHLARFARLWVATDVIEVDDVLCRSAARLSSDRGLRTLDAIHLASALAVADENLVLATWDRRLWDAARAEGLAVLPDNRP